MNEEQKAKYGPALFEIIENRKKHNALGGLDVNDYMLWVDDDNEDDWSWVYYPDID